MNLAAKQTIISEKVTLNMKSAKIHDHQSATCDLSMIQQAVPIS
jgi:hypothetical protein